MIKKKAIGKKVTRKTTKRKKSMKKAGETKLNPSEVRKDIAAMVEAEAGELAGAVIEEGKKGQLATVKYLFEMAHIYPEALVEAIIEDGKKNAEKSLAETLLDSLGIPKDPVIHDMYEKGEEIVIAPRREAPPEGEEKAAVSEAEKESELVAIS